MNSIQLAAHINSRQLERRVEGMSGDNRPPEWLSNIPPSPTHHNSAMREVVLWVSGLVSSVTSAVTIDER